MYKMQPNNFGIPSLVSNTVNQFFQESLAKRLGIFCEVAQNYFLVVKSLQRGAGNFLIRLVPEYGNIIFVFLFGISIVSLVYIAKLRLNIQRRYRPN